MDVQSLIAQYDRESAALLQVYQQRFELECPALPADLSALCARTLASEWTWSRAFAETAALLREVRDPLLRDIVVEKLTKMKDDVAAVQDDIAATLLFADPDLPVRDLEACVRQIRRFSPVDCAASCDYLLDVLARVCESYAVYDASLGGFEPRFESEALGAPRLSTQVCQLTTLAGAKA